MTSDRIEPPFDSPHAHPFVPGREVYEVCETCAYGRSHRWHDTPPSANEPPPFNSGREHPGCRYYAALMDGGWFCNKCGWGAATEPPIIARCEHGLPETLDCEQCLWAQTVADAQATDEDYDDG
jgi:hypothetical protein